MVKSVLYFSIISRLGEMIFLTKSHFLVVPIPLNSEEFLKSSNISLYFFLLSDNLAISQAIYIVKYYRTRKDIGLFLMEKLLPHVFLIRKVF